MNTLSKSHPSSLSEKTEKIKATFALSKLLDDLETTRFAIAPMLLTAMVCLGGIAAAFAVQENEIKLMAVAITTVFIEILVIALAPMRMIVVAAAIAFTMDLLVFIF